MAEIGDNEGILGNNFAMAHELTVRPCEGVGQGIDGEREFRSGGTRATWKTSRNPGVPSKPSDPAGGKGSHHAPLRPPIAGPRPGLNAHRR